MTPNDLPDIVVHASCVAFGDQAILISGRSGTGKSTLALELISLGAKLVADDQTELRRTGDQIIASCPPTIRGRIEARYIGILQAPDAGPTPISHIIDMNHTSSERLPQYSERRILDVPLPLIYKVENSAFASALKLLIAFGRSE